jgi:colicin import membrane protein
VVGGGGILAGLDFILYKNQVEGIIKRNWTWVGTNPNLTVKVGFRIREDGEIVDVRILQSSGDAGYDQSVLQAIRASTPLPPPPEKYRDVFGDYRIDFVSGNLQSGKLDTASRRRA